MRKQWFWAIEHSCRSTRWVFRFRTRKERDDYLDLRNRIDNEDVPGTHPEVRRIKRRIAAGEQVTFPVEID